MICTRLDIPRYLRDGIKPNDRGARVDKYIYGADSETLNGEPMTLQFYSEDTACSELHFVDKQSACKVFLKWCGQRRKRMQHIVYVHNLSFDLVEFFWGHHHKLISAAGDFDFKIGKWLCRGVYGTPTFCRISDGEISVILVDSFSYFRGSLDNAAKLFCPDLPKLRRVNGLGSKQFRKSDTDFCAYAMRDPEITYHVGKSIEAMHQQYDLQQCVSVADMASRIFRHRFLDYTIVQPERDVIEAALLSYHGGKNNVHGKAGWYTACNALDISSAYPDAMRMLPAFSNAKLFRRYNSRKHAGNVPEVGVYRVSGNVEQCSWPSVFSHSFKPIAGKFAGICIQGYELNEAIRSGELKVSKLSGWFYDGEKDLQAPALRAFVDDFYAKKESEKDKVLRFMYKLILNSISGKFIQTRKSNACAYTDIDADVTVSASELTAGGMFHPFIASAITAHTRARIHRLEHKYKAIHTATDGIFTQMKVATPTTHRVTDLTPSKKGSLGALTLENRGDLLLVRNKCYILYASNGEVASKAFKGKKIAKWALHGFQGRVYDLERLIASNKRKYKVNKPHRLREALKRNLVPNLFVEREYTLKVPPLNLVQKPAR